MKIIDILNKIVNGEEVPKKIKINGYIYEYQGDDYLYIDKNNDNHEYWLFSDSYTNKFQWLDVFLKTEVEIIEEEKKIPEKIDVWYDPIKDTKLERHDTDTSIEILAAMCDDLKDKYNEILDYLKSKGDE